MYSQYKTRVSVSLSEVLETGDDSLLKAFKDDLFFLEPLPPALAAALEQRRQRVRERRRAKEVYTPHARTSILPPDVQAILTPGSRSVNSPLLVADGEQSGHGAPLLAAHDAAGQGPQRHTLSQLHTARVQAHGARHPARPLPSPARPAADAPSLATRADNNI
ncbi:hypothetical protein EON67_11670 [archaeon]|nr:MAG: hypothetical protein EON67_11670 [archaeon]